MLRFIALSTLVACPPAYVAMKAAAIERHIEFNKRLEGGDGDIRDTWHEQMLAWVYPV